MLCIVARAAQSASAERAAGRECLQSGRSAEVVGIRIGGRAPSTGRQGKHMEKEGMAQHAGGAWDNEQQALAAGNGAVRAEKNGVEKCKQNSKVRQTGEDGWRRGVQRRRAAGRGRQAPCQRRGWVLRPGVGAPQSGVLAGPSAAARWVGLGSVNLAAQGCWRQRRHRRNRCHARPCSAASCAPLFSCRLFTSGCR